MSQQEDDLRALAKIMDFLRAVSILFVVINIYWYCYEAVKLWGVNIGVVDKILMNFHRTDIRCDLHRPQHGLRAERLTHGKGTFRECLAGMGNRKGQPDTNGHRYYRNRTTHR